MAAGIRAFVYGHRIRRSYTAYLLVSSSWVLASWRRSKLTGRWQTLGVGLACRLQGMQFAAALMGGGGRGKGGKDSPGKEKPFPPCEIRPVPGVTVRVSCAADGVLALEWRDDRRAPGGSADGVTCQNGSVTACSFKIVVALLRRIVFGDRQHSSALEILKMAADMASEGATAAPPHEMVLHFQRTDDRAAIRRVTMSTSSSGQLTGFTIADGASSSLLRHTQTCALMDMLKEMCSGPHPFVLVKPPMWAEMPQELWGHVVNRMTQREGRAVSCSCKQISQMVKLPSFIWVHEKMHLDIKSAAEAVRSRFSCSFRPPLSLPPGHVGLLWRAVQKRELLGAVSRLL